jgi:hypothetical protein
LKYLSSFFSLASGVFAVVPGITVLLSNVGVPPNSSKALFAGTIEALGVITLMLLSLNKVWIEKQSLQSVTKTAIAGVVVFIIALFTYIFLYGYSVVEVKNSTPLFFPLWERGDLNMLLKRFGSRAELIKELGRDDVFELIKETSTVPLLATTLLFLFIYQLMFVALTFSFGVLGIKSTSTG